ncbi:hypothetical protein CANCADRAFT_19410, partial [Tortispora caseinolytica NRRL Y-17796]
LSRFTYGDILRLKSPTSDEARNAIKSTSSRPLKAVIHIDLDAFYAQCESVRLKLPPSAPLACQQWANVIAVNYAARDFGITRHSSAQQCKEVCPNIVLAHVACFKEGEESWAYHPNPDRDHYKACLDPYRRESRKIMSIFKQFTDIIEKASIDESFLDVSDKAAEIITAQFPEIFSLPVDQSMLSKHLPLPSQKIYPEWIGENVEVYGIESLDEKISLDWDDVLVLVTSKIASEMRKKVHEELSYTCSAGISVTKSISKLASTYKKPNGQTVVLPAFVKDFLANNFEFTDIRGFGGKLGDEIRRKLSLPEEKTIARLLEISRKEMENKLGKDTATWVYDEIRGEHSQDLITRTDIKSMQSVKNFRQPLENVARVHAWLKIFVFDLTGRLSDADEEDSKNL